MAVVSDGGGMPREPPISVALRFGSTVYGRERSLTDRSVDRYGAPLLKSAREEAAVCRSGIRGLAPVALAGSPIAAAGVQVAPDRARLGLVNAATLPSPVARSAVPITYVVVALASIKVTGHVSRVQQNVSYRTACRVH